MLLTRLNDKGQIAFTELKFRRRDWWLSIQERVVGRSLAAENTSYLWDPMRGRVPLSRYVSRIGTFVVRDLNNNGVIVGTAEMKDGTIRSVLLEPIPERWGK